MSENQPATIKLIDCWRNHLTEELQKPYMQSLRAFLTQEKQSGKIIYPKGGEIFNALNHTPIKNTKVVILGQDPYHGPRQAHGFCFSVQKGINIPPSLQNIYKELVQDVNFHPPGHGNLQKWADQGVLLLNSVLTVEATKAASHQGQGWEQFTDKIIDTVNKECDHVVFMLWGSYAQKKGQFIDTTKHLVLKAPHPSPLSAHRGFLGCRHFSKANDFLISHGKTPIQWQI